MKLTRRTFQFQVRRFLQLLQTVRESELREKILKDVEEAIEPPDNHLDKLMNEVLIAIERYLK